MGSTSIANAAPIMSSKAIIRNASPPARRNASCTPNTTPIGVVIKSRGLAIRMSKPYRLGGLRGTAACYRHSSLENRYESLVKLARIHSGEKQVFETVARIPERIDSCHRERHLGRSAPLEREPGLGAHTGIVPVHEQLAADPHHRAAQPGRLAGAKFHPRAVSADVNLAEPGVAVNAEHIAQGLGGD